MEYRMKVETRPDGTIKTIKLNYKGSILKYPLKKIIDVEELFSDIAGFFDLKINVWDKKR